MSKKWAWVVVAVVTIGAAALLYPLVWRLYSIRDYVRESDLVEISEITGVIFPENTELLDSRLRRTFMGMSYTFSARVRFKKERLQQFLESVPKEEPSDLRKPESFTPARTTLREALSHADERAGEGWDLDSIRNSIVLDYRNWAGRPKFHASPCGQILADLDEEEYVTVFIYALWIEGFT